MIHRICLFTKKNLQGRRNEKRARGADFVEGHQQNFNYVRIHTLEFRGLDPVHTGPDPYGHQTAMTLKFVIILQNLIKAYHRKMVRVNMTVN